MRLSVFVALGVLLGSQVGWAASPLVIHEWGTFTAVQDERGVALKGINSDDEPVPAFVHSLGESLVVRPEYRPSPFSKALPASHPGVTMRLETPVLYAYPPEGEVVKFSVSVDFRGGLLTQFYPKVTGASPERIDATKTKLDASTVGTLAWVDVVADGDGGAGATGLPETKDVVWTAPRAVRAAPVTVNGETEKFLFYRGVGDVASPLRVMRNGSQLMFSSQMGIEMAQAGSIRVAWLYERRADGTSAYRKVALRPSNPMSCAAIMDTTEAEFAGSAFTKESLDGLRGELHAALVSDGLFDDEAEAMLNTWKASYFDAPGQRVFFVLPKAWTKAVLPLRVSGPAEVVRTMVGRIDLVTPGQREVLGNIWAAKEVGEVGKLYDRLGRFRNALLLDYLEGHPSDVVKAFVVRERIGYAPVPGEKRE